MPRDTALEPVAATSAADPDLSELRRRLEADRAELVDMLAGSDRLEPGIMRLLADVQSGIAALREVMAAEAERCL